MATQIADLRGVVKNLGRNSNFDHIVVDLPEPWRDVTLDIAPGTAEGIKLGDEIHVEVWWEPSAETFDTPEEAAAQAVHDEVAQEDAAAIAKEQAGA